VARKTYEKIQESSVWPYGNRPCWVWSNSKLKLKLNHVIETKSSPKEIIKTAQEKGLDHLWLVVLR